MLRIKIEKRKLTKCNALPVSHGVAAILFGKAVWRCSGGGEVLPWS
jgi:hypothetical protein